MTASVCLPKRQWAQSMAPQAEEPDRSLPLDSFPLKSFSVPTSNIVRSFSPTRVLSTAIRC